MNACILNVVSASLTKDNTDHGSFSSETVISFKLHALWINNQLRNILKNLFESLNQSGVSMTIVKSTKDVVNPGSFKNTLAKFLLENQYWIRSKRYNLNVRSKNSNVMILSRWKLASPFPGLFVLKHFDSLLSILQKAVPWSLIAIPSIIYSRGRISVCFPRDKKTWF